LKQLGIDADAAAGFIGASHSVTDWENRESDLEVVFDRRDGARVAILVEDKIDAGFSGDQDRRYRCRARLGVEEGLWDQAVTCLIAPESYLAAIERSDWDQCLAIDDIVSWLRHETNDPYAPAFVQILERAVEKKTRGPRSKETSDSITTFFERYAEHCRESHPEALMYPVRGSKTYNAYNWIWFGFGRLPRDRRIEVYHKTVSSRGSWVEMRIQYCRLEDFRSALGGSAHWLELQRSGALIEARRSRGSESLFVKIPAERVDIRADFEPQIHAVDDAVKKALALLRFFAAEEESLLRLANSSKP
jgi:hypothetical protein